MNKEKNGVEGEFRVCSMQKPTHTEEQLIPIRGFCVC